MKAVSIVQVVLELSDAGGAETVALELARAFGRAGVANSILANRTGHAADPDISVKIVGWWLSRIPTWGRFRYLGRMVAVPLFTLAAMVALKRVRGAILISHGDTFGGDILVVHAVNAASLAEKRRAGEWGWLLNPMHAWVYFRDHWTRRGLRFKMFVAVSARGAIEVQRYYGVPKDRVRVIPNGIDLDRFRADPVARQVIREEFAIPIDAKLLLFVGHEFGRKGLGFAIEALKRLDAAVWLLVVGSDQARPYLQRAAGVTRRIVFAGTRSDMPRLYAAADALVLPSAYETFSLVCMEALASGVPILACPVGGIEDYLEDDWNGYRISTDADDIADNAMRLFQQQAVSNRLSQNARETAKQFGWDGICQQYLDLIGSLA